MNWTLVGPIVGLVLILLIFFRFWSLDSLLDLVDSARGSELVMYALIMLLIIVIVIASLVVLSPIVGEPFRTINNSLQAV